MQTILIPVDFSTPSRAALGWAFAYAQRNPCDIHVLHVIDGHAHLSEVLDPTPSRLQNELADVTREEKEELARSAHTTQERDRIGQLHHHVCIGKPAAEIVRLAGKLGCDLVVMGTHGRRGAIERVLVGSVAERVVRDAPCPVVCVKTPGKVCAQAAS
jgi:nucleotide-binding universal stress UspA family protein